METAHAAAQDFIKLVLPFGTTEAEMRQFAEKHGYELVRSDPEDRARQALLTVTYRHRSLDIYLQYIFNYLIHIATVRCFGADKLEAVGMLNSFFYVVDEGEIRKRMSSQAPGDRGLAMAYLAEFAPAGFDAKIIDLFDKGASDADKDVREFAFLAMAMAGWGELLPIAQRALGSEQDDHLRGQLERLVANLRARL